MTDHDHIRQVEGLIDALIDLLDDWQAPLEVAIPALAAVNAVALREYCMEHGVPLEGMTQRLLRELELHRVRRPRWRVSH